MGPKWTKTVSLPADGHCKPFSRAHSSCRAAPWKVIIPSLSTGLPPTPKYKGSKFAKMSAKHMQNIWVKWPIPLPGWLSFACHGLGMAGATLVKQAWPLFLWSLWVWSLVRKSFGSIAVFSNLETGTFARLIWFGPGFVILGFPT